MARLVLPNGRGHGWRRDTPDNVRDRRMTRRVQEIGRKLVPDTPYYLKPEALSPTRDQGPQGSCTGHGLVQALEWSYRATRSIDVTLSPAMAYLNGRIIEASVKEDSGCEIRDVVKAAAKTGVCLEKYAPYNPNKLQTTITKQQALNASFHQIKLGYYRCDDLVSQPGMSVRDAFVDNMIQALLNDMPIDGGYSWYSCLDTADFERNGVMAVPTTRDRLEGGHCNWVCGVDVRARMFILQNSYGDKFGAKHPVTQKGGFLIMPFAYVLNGIWDDAWAILHE
jgi:hypothetical protein